MFSSNLRAHALGRMVLFFSFCLAPMTTSTCVAGKEPRNLAIVAQPSSSFTSHDTTVNALNDGYAPASSYEWSHGTYGNYNRRGTQWVEYQWDAPITTSRIEVYWWDDNRGIDLPASARLLYWKDGEYRAVPGGEQVGVTGDKFNVVEFDIITTPRLRLEIDSDGEHSTGILEWRVLDNGESPAFPPRVVGDADRIVMLDSKTYLHGNIISLDDTAELQVRWSKLSGPGDVQFEDAQALTTTARFSDLGSYQLQLTVGNDAGEMSAIVNVEVEQPPTEEPLEVVYTTPYKIDSPLWDGRLHAVITNWIPHCIDLIEDPELKEGGLNNFAEAAKKLQGEQASAHRGYVFSNAWVHQTVESICLALMVDPNGDQEMIDAQTDMKATLEDWIPQILAAQEPDGYLQTAFTLNDRMDRWQPAHRTGHEGYVAGYFLESAIAHYQLTDGTDRRLYNAAKKLADCWATNIGPGKQQQLWWDEHQEMEQALVRFGVFVNKVDGPGAGDKYIALAKFLLDCRQEGSKYSQSHLPVQQQYEAVGHAVRAVYLYSGMADIATEMGDAEYRSAVKSLWDNLVNKKYYVTGGIGSGESSEGFGANYSLPNNAYCESCSSCGMLFLEQKMNRAYHDAKYIDLLEETLYNALLGSLDLPGENFYYQNPLVSWNGRYPWHVCPCCVGNIPRTLLMLPSWAFATNDDNLYVQLFVGGTFDVGKVAGTEVEVVQETRYPWDGNVKIVINPQEEKEFAVRVRIPQRDVSTLYSSTPAELGYDSLTVNGERVPTNIEQGYAVVRRVWKPGDTLELVLPLPVQRVKCDDRVQANRGRVALRRGPLVYNIESVDGNKMDGVLDASTELTTEWRDDLLGGVMVIRGKFADGSALLAIPNYARNNRGGASQVWIRSQ
ncbi:glycoside hydrolase family 127 protein [Aeoliella sp. ICT_H6.2]|uniref:Glycoside hydrolase family 127 protein n=1 Tax=Aeoliella straminimaris TaxID=2954799 RepID=A0A9X2F8A9_9BACT|nr:beta-L-arabinofuranosidase domain-containing protein [Aeoliella straminimaris]MCO6043689.1 glycoside hydrolase family 127 protein [Aeoliella straminimaris]